MARKKRKPPNEFGHLIRRHAARHNLTQAEFARRVGLSDTQIGNYLKEGLRRPPDVDTIERIAAVLRVPNETIIVAVYRTLGLPVRLAEYADDLSECRRRLAANPDIDPLERAMAMSVLDTIERGIRERARADREDAGAPGGGPPAPGVNRDHTTGGGPDEQRQREPGLDGHDPAD